VTIRLLLQPSVSGVAESLLLSGLTVDILSIFCDGFMVHCVKFVNFCTCGFLLFDGFVCRQNVTCLEQFVYGHYTQFRWKT